ncbi:MAG TPA: PIN domain-containing protein [Geobacteraceae bacterium]
MKTDRVLPDTCAWIDFFNARRTPLSVALEQLLLQGEVFTCGIVKYELIQGVRSQAEEKALLHALQAVNHLEMNESLWIQAGRLSSDLRKKGVTIPFSDISIAVLARENDLTVLTIDLHFEQIAGVKVKAA